ncbi:MAG: ribonuclease III [Lachnospiraceae bacterium]|nr:ribonuclease III [Lachnospiraceae bacterium]
MLEFKPEEIESRTGYTFKDRTLLRSALSHRSYVNELRINKYPDYERLEFLGDAVLELTVSDFLYKNHPEMPEGDLSKLRSALVCEPSLAECAKELNLPDYILVGHGEEEQGSRFKDSIVSDVFEALIGAIYLDGGFEAAKAHIDKYVLQDMDNKRLFYDAKSILQERCQKEGNTLEYIIVDESGPDHKKTYVVDALVNGLRVSRGEGSSKRKAEQQAAYEYLRGKSR